MSSNYKKGYTDKKTIDYIKNNYDQFSLRMPKGDRQKYKDLAEEQGKSLNTLIIELLNSESARVREEEQKKRIFTYAELLEDTGLSEKVVDSICDVAHKNRIKKVLLFGSRARGDFNRASDIDLAAFGENVTSFRTALEEMVPTLLTFDVVDMLSKPSKRILDTIQKEGRILYEEV